VVARAPYLIRRLSVWAAMAIAVAGMVACAPRIQPRGAPVHEPILTDQAMIATDGAELPARRWLPESEVRAVVVAVHGFNDYSHAFADIGAALAGQGIAVHAYDQRGFGATARPGIWAGTEALVDDLRQICALLRTRYPSLPLFVLGDSMGGAVTMVGLARGVLGPIDGAILVAPAVWGRETMNLFYRAALWLSAHTVPWLRASGRGLDITPSDNREMLIALGRDPLVIKETRIDAVWGIADLMDAALAAAPALTTPLLVAYGAHDEIIPRTPTLLMLDRLSGPRRIAVYPDGWHMLLRDLQAGVVHADIAAWITDPAAPLPSGHDHDWRPLLATP